MNNCHNMCTACKRVVTIMAVCRQNASMLPAIWVSSLIKDCAPAAGTDSKKAPAKLYALPVQCVSVAYTKSGRYAGTAAAVFIELRHGIDGEVYCCGKLICIRV